MSLDPFAPEKDDDVKRLKALQADVHENFADLVKERRGRRIGGGRVDDDGLGLRGVDDALAQRAGTGRMPVPNRDVVTELPQRGDRGPGGAARPHHERTTAAARQEIQEREVVGPDGEATERVHAFDRTWGRWLKEGEKVYDKK